MIATATPDAVFAGAIRDGWWVYVVRCRDGTFYTGIARDLAGRLREHNGDDRRAARYTRSRRPVVLHAACVVPDRRAAARLEHRVKTLSRAGKEALPNTPGWLAGD